MRGGDSEGLTFKLKSEEAKGPSLREMREMEGGRERENLLTGGARPGVTWGMWVFKCSEKPLKS